MKNRLFIIIVLLTFVKICFAQDYFSDFQKYLNDGDTIKQVEILQKWNEDNPQDPELFTSYFNYYFSLSKKEILILASGDPPDDEKIIQITDSLDNYVGYIGSKIDYEKSNIIKGLDKINEGIILYPDRLDMRFGKIYVLGEIKDWRSFTNEIIECIDYSDKNKNKWTWTLNEKRKDGKEFFLSSLQDYQIQLYNAGDDDLIPYFQEIAQEVLKYYPEHVESLSNLAIGYLIFKDYDKAITPLLRAEKINPQDYIVLSNIAYTYRQKGDTSNAIMYYEKLIKYGDEQAKAYGKQEIDLLQKNQD